MYEINHRLQWRGQKHIPHGCSEGRIHRIVGQLVEKGHPKMGPAVNFGGCPKHTNPSTAMALTSHPICTKALHKSAGRHFHFYFYPYCLYYINLATAVQLSAPTISDVSTFVPASHASAGGAMPPPWFPAKPKLEMWNLNLGMGQQKNEIQKTSEFYMFNEFNKCLFHAQQKRRG